MDINPYEARLRILQVQDGVQMQREATPGSETAGCPGCPFYWTCDVPHRAEDVAVPAEYDREEVADQVPSRGEYTPRDTGDIGWTDEWVEHDEPADGPASAEDRGPEVEISDDEAAAPRPSWRDRFRRRRP